MDEDIKKLRFLLEHWVEHNEDHKKNFVKWVKIAKESGVDRAAESLAKAVDAIDESSKYLQEALKDLENDSA